MKNFDEKELENRLNEIDWSTYYDLVNPEECWVHIYTLIRVIDELYPEKAMTNVRKKTEWLTCNLLSS